MSTCHARRESLVTLPRSQALGLYPSLSDQAAENKSSPICIFGRTVSAHEATREMIPSQEGFVTGFGPRDVERKTEVSRDT